MQFKCSTKIFSYIFFDFAIFQCFLFACQKKKCELCIGKFLYYVKACPY